MLLRLGDQGRDVADLQQKLYQAGFTKVLKTHIYDDATETAIKTLQKKARLVVDGIYGPKTAMALNSKGTKKYLKESELQLAADDLGVDLATVKAINEVESRGCGFLDDGNPIILFERHVFYRLLSAKKFNMKDLTSRYPGIVNKSPGGYVGGREEYTRLRVADTIDQVSALESCSWGIYQIMGYHWERLGYASIYDFVKAMRESEATQLDAFVRFVKSDNKLHEALKDKKWDEVARIYNGPNYKRNLYDIKLERAYDRFSA